MIDRFNRWSLLAARAAENTPASALLVQLFSDHPVQKSALVRDTTATSCRGFLHIYLVTPDFPKHTPEVASEIRRHIVLAPTSVQHCRGDHREVRLGIDTLGISGGG